MEQKIKKLLSTIVHPESGRNILESGIVERVDLQEGKIAVTLRFENINDFTPDAIVRQVPELARLLELRESLKALKGPLANVPEFRRKVQEMVSDEKARAALLSELNLDEK